MTDKGTDDSGGMGSTDGVPTGDTGAGPTDDASLEDADADGAAGEKSDEARSGTFVVTHADEGSAVLRDVETAQVHTLSSNPDLDERAIIEATVRPEPPLDVAWEVTELVERRTVDVIDSDLSPTSLEREVAAEQTVGDIETIERAGTGEIHVLSVPPEGAENAASEVVNDLETVARAARLDAIRVEVRCDSDDGILSVRYLPD